MLKATVFFIFLIMCRGFPDLSNTWLELNLEAPPHSALQTFFKNPFHNVHYRNHFHALFSKARGKGAGKLEAEGAASNGNTPSPHSLGAAPVISELGELLVTGATSCSMDGESWKLGLWPTFTPGSDSQGTSCGVEQARGSGLLCLFILLLPQ